MQEIEILGKFNRPTSGEGEMILSWNSCLWSGPLADSEGPGISKLLQMGVRSNTEKRVFSTDLLRRNGEAFGTSVVSVRNDEGKFADERRKRSASSH